MPIVYVNTINSKDTTNFLHDISTACFYSIPFFESVRVVRLNSFQVEFVRVALKDLEIDTLNKEVGLGTRLRNRNETASLNTWNVANKDFFEHVFHD